MAQADIAVDVSRRDMICARGRRAGLRMHDARRCYFAIASLAGLLRSMRLLLGGRAGRLVGMLSGLDARAPPAFGAPGVIGGLAIDAEFGRRRGLGLRACFQSDAEHGCYEGKGDDVAGKRFNGTGFHGFLRIDGAFRLNSTKRGHLVL
jgi:hypothetical protein